MEVSRHGVETFCQIPLSKLKIVFEINGSDWNGWHPISHPK